MEACQYQRPEYRPPGETPVNVELISELCVSLAARRLRAREVRVIAGSRFLPDAIHSALRRKGKEAFYRGKERAKCCKCKFYKDQNNPEIAPFIHLFKVLDSLGIACPLPRAPAKDQMEIVYTQLENMLFKSLLTSKKELLKGADKVDTVADVLSAHFLAKDGYVAYQAGKNNLDAYEASHQIVLRSLPAVFPNLKDYAPSFELISCLLDSIQGIPFTENPSIMRIVSQNIILF